MQKKNLISNLANSQTRFRAIFADIRNFQKHWFVIVQELLWQWGNFGWKYNNPKLLLKEETYRFGVTVLLEKEVVEFYMRYCNNTEKK